MSPRHVTGTTDAAAQALNPAGIEAPQTSERRFCQERPVWAWQELHAAADHPTSRCVTVSGLGPSKVRQVRRSDHDQSGATIRGRVRCRAWDDDSRHQPLVFGETSSRTWNLHGGCACGSSRCVTAGWPVRCLSDNGHSVTPGLDSGPAPADAGLIRPTRGVNEIEAIAVDDALGYVSYANPRQAGARARREDGQSALDVHREAFAWRQRDRL